MTLSTNIQRVSTDESNARRLLQSTLTASQLAAASNLTAVESRVRGTESRLGGVDTNLAATSSILDTAVNNVSLLRRDVASINCLSPASFAASMSDLRSMMQSLQCGRGLIFNATQGRCVCEAANTQWSASLGACVPALGLVDTAPGQDCATILGPTTTQTKQPQKGKIIKQTIVRDGGQMIVFSFFDLEQLRKNLSTVP